MCLLVLLYNLSACAVVESFETVNLAISFLSRGVDGLGLGFAVGGVKETCDRRGCYDEMNFPF